MLAPVEFRDILDALNDAAAGGDERMKDVAAVNAAAAVAAVAEQGIFECDPVAEQEGEVRDVEAASVFVLLNAKSSRATRRNTNPNNAAVHPANIVDIQAQRIIDLETALQAERDAHLHSARQHWQLKSESDRVAFERAVQSVCSTPRVVEVARDVSRDLEKHELMQQLHQAREEAQHFRSE